VIPVVTPSEMAAVDAAASEPVSVLIERAGAAVAREALDLLGGAYGRTVVVIAGKGNNGNDGRAAARRLRRRGARVLEIDAAAAPAALPPADLVIDAAYGTGLERRYDPPALCGAPPVLAVDIPSGVHGLTGALLGTPLLATRTVTFAALKPGLLLEPGRSRCGDVRVADIGLDVSRARAHQLEAADVRAWVCGRAVDDHKWKHAVWVVAGSPGMRGAARLASEAALRAGAGYVRLSTPGAGEDPGAATEVVQVPVDRALTLDPADVRRFGAVLVGPGLGRAPDTMAAARELIASIAAPVVVDGDGLTALAGHADEVLSERVRPTVLTPHEREFHALAGTHGAIGPDRFDAVRSLAARLGAVVLLKGPTTIVAGPNGDALVSLTGDQRLATAGTGDVLAGIIAALLAGGLDASRAAGAGAYVHGAAATLGPARGLVAGDLLDLLPHVFARLGVR
jgi:NAD(P)H-hydrate epimerase